MKLETPFAFTFDRIETIRPICIVHNYIFKMVLLYIRPTFSRKYDLVFRKYYLGLTFVWNYIYRLLLNKVLFNCYKCTNTAHKQVLTKRLYKCSINVNVSLSPQFWCYLFIFNWWIPFNGHNGTDSTVGTSTE